MLLAAAVAGCHAHGGTAVSATDRGVTTSLHRTMSQYLSVQLDFKNGSAVPVCLDPASFSPTSFTIKNDQGAAVGPQGVTPPPAPVPAACDTLAPGADRRQALDLAGFSRLEAQTGRVCYHYAYTQSPPDPAGWRAAGDICE
jgi:hypothetical protein